MTLEELAARVEAAEGPDRELDLAIEGVVSPGVKGVTDPLLAYTASLDAAMTLVPEGCGVAITRYWIAAKHGPVWAAELATGGIPDNPRQVFDCYDAATPALALTAACLRARATCS